MRVQVVEMVRRNFLNYFECFILSQVSLDSALIEMLTFQTCNVCNVLTKTVKA